MELDFPTNHPRKESVEKLIAQNKATQKKLFQISLILIGLILGWTLRYFL